MKQVKYGYTMYKKPWITKDILTKINSKNKLHRRMKLHGDYSLKTEYNQIKNKLSNLFKQSEKNYYKNLLDNTKNN